ncbi:response regulator [Rhizomicrobium electricum]|uniref:Response regulatory domain-containing protein n=1 Tax=Rhizomicrobium electricum TaxID=480070 RepID=A0ABN1EU79_9PROT|nr:response regulator [Rhizomicrobium electricum]NIJ49763.1 DNA-binding response OmpR family regulator [Rhizomicrobium electricum]
MMIAVIDDDEFVRDSTRLLLESYGFVVECFESAEQFSAETATSFHCLLLDQNMPGMSGLELIELHRQRQLTIPVLLITGRGSSPIAARAKELGAVYLEKPLQEDVLVREIEKAVMAAKQPSPWRYPAYSLYLRGRDGAVVARRSLSAIDDDEAATLAAVLHEASSDIAGQCELWCGDREIVVPAKVLTAAQVNARLQKLVVDHEIALRDSRWHIAQSRRLLEKIDGWANHTNGI